jgi:hypothetical protein
VTVFRCADCGRELTPQLASDCLGPHELHLDPLRVLPVDRVFSAA